MIPAGITPATAAHAAVLAAIHGASFPPAERWDEAAIATLLATPGTFGLHAEDAAFILARAVADEAEILTIAVHPARRRVGLGHRLLGTALAAAAANGAASCVLEVAVGNAPARALYAAWGFAAAGRRRAYYPDGDDALILRAPLPPPG